MKTIRIGAGAGFAGDRIQPARDLAERGCLDFLVFECLAERTIALAQLRERNGKEPGYDMMLPQRMHAVLPACHRNRVKIISNMGGANPGAAAERTVQIARELGLHGLRVACVSGDDVLGLSEEFVSFPDDPFPRNCSFLSANAYLGADPIVAALHAGADIVLTGRVADPSLFLAPLVYSWGWRADDWPRLGQGIAIGHMLECAGQLTGGYFADPGYKEVPGLAHLGFPLAEVGEDGTAEFTKLPETGGVLNLQTCREQLLYEVLDPAAYITPDVIADFTGVALEQAGQDKVRMHGARGQERPPRYKVSVGVRNGFHAEGQISYAGSGAVARAGLARDILRSRLQTSGELRFDLIGMNSLHGDAAAKLPDAYEVRLRAASSFEHIEDAHHLAQEVESLYVNGPAGGGGITTSVRESVAIYPALLSRDRVTPAFSLVVA